MKKKLIVEDSHEMRNNLIDILENKGYDTYSAENGIDGLVFAERILPDLILSDIMMPTMGDIHLLYEITNSELIKNIPLVFISARVTKFDRDFALRVGAKGYITKPFTIASLMNIVNKIIKYN